MSTTSSASPRPYWPANSLAAFFDFATSSNGRAAAMLLVAALILFLPGFFRIPPIDRDEAYFAQASKQMIETGDYVDIRYRNDVRYRKPVGIYWLQTAVVKTATALGVPNALTTIWLYRVPSLLGAVGAVLATFWCGLAFVSRRGATLAALMMAASPLLGVEARLAKTDAVLLLTVVIAMGALARIYFASRSVAKRSDWTLPAIFWSALAAGFLVKGPVILMVVGLAIVTLSVIDRSARWLLTLRPLAGVGWLILIVAPWFIAIYLRAGDQFFVDSVGHDMLGKIAYVQETHGAPPGLYLIAFFLTFFPGSMLAPLATPAVWAGRRESPTRFLLAWLIPSWIVFELVATKLPHYVLPLYPAIAILIAAAVEAKALSRRRWLMLNAMWWFVIPILLSIAAVAIAFIFDRELALFAWPFFAAAIVCGLFAWQLYEDGGAERAILRAFAIAALMAAGVFGIVIPSLARTFPGVAIARVLHRAACAHPAGAIVGYAEPSVVFLTGDATHFADAAGAADFLQQGSCHFAFVDTRQERAFTVRAEAIGLHYDRQPLIKGFNLGTSKLITFAVFNSAGTP